jgi:hypothetical protein
MNTQKIFGLTLITGLMLCAAAGRTWAQSACGYSLGSGIYNKWMQMGGERGVLGCAIMNEAEAGRSPQGTTGRWVEFNGGDGGYIVWHGSGRYAGKSFEVHGCIFRLYRSIGGSNSWLGFPISDEYDVPGGRRSDFEGGYVLWNAQTRRCEAFRNETPGGNIGAGDSTQSLAGSWRWNLACANKFPNGSGQMRITLGPDGKYTGSFTSQWGEVRSGAITEGVQQGAEITFNFNPGGWTSYLIWKGTIVRDRDGVRIVGTTFYYGGQDCRFTMYRDGNGQNGSAGGGVCADPRTLAIMDEWLGRAIPLQNRRPGWSVRYDSWGRLVGRSPTAVMNASGSPDTSMTRCEYLWRYTADRGSINLGSLREYVERRR